MDMQTISPQELFQIQSDGKPYRMIDVRTPGEYAALHAQGAQLVPLDRLDPHSVLSGAEGGGQETLYIICQSGSRTALAWAKFQAAGFNNVVGVQGGTEAWVRAGLPTVKGKGNVISLERQVRIAAGSLVLLGAALGWLVHPAFHILSALIGAGLIFAGVTGSCGMGMLLAKMPWNGARGCSAG
jgi:rhodanese-related sulfurtransferase